MLSRLLKEFNEYECKTEKRRVILGRRNLLDIDWHGTEKREGRPSLLDVDWKQAEAKERKPSVLDIDFQHEAYEPVVQHEKYHPLEGEPPTVPYPENYILDEDFHPDVRSDLYAGEDSEALDNQSIERAQRAVKYMTS